MIKLTDDQKRAIKVVDSFLKDPNAFDCFISGQAGVGKTTLLNYLVQKLMEKEIPYVVCAYTHKAKKVLESKLPKGADVRTLHSFLRKRPGINENAKTIHKLQTTTQFGHPQQVKLLIVDEYSMVGESDVMSIGELQDPDYQGVPEMKVLYVGDYRQLAPVGQTFTLDPHRAEYSYTLTEVQRQSAGPLLSTICEVVDMIDGKKPIGYLEPNAEFHRDIDIPTHIADNKPKDFAVLAYTNKRVQELNSAIHDVVGSTDLRWSPTLRAELQVGLQYEPYEVAAIWIHSGILELESKYRTLEHIQKISKDYSIQFGEFVNLTEDTTQTIAYIFGHYEYKLALEKLAQEATRANEAINHRSPKKYCLENPHCKECRRRAKAWRDYLTVKECVMCVDYPYAQTIHKSQGSTFKNVYIDNEDLKLLLKTGRTETYLKLLYVGISRASNQVFMNS